MQMLIGDWRMYYPFCNFSLVELLYLVSPLCPSLSAGYLSVIVSMTDNFMVDWMLHFCDKNVPVENIYSKFGKVPLQLFFLS